MKIYHRNLDSRIGRKFEHVQRAAPGADYLLLVHPDDTRHEVLRGRLDQYRRDPRCKYVLFIKGARFGGLGSADTARDLERELGPEVHFLRYALADGQQPRELLQRVHTFLDHVEQRDTVDWRLLYPKELPCIHALWARLSALRCLPHSVAGDWRSALVEDVELWRQAEAEYKLHTIHGFSWPVNTVSDETLEAWTEEIRGCVLELSRQSI